MTCKCNQDAKRQRFKLDCGTIDGNAKWHALEAAIDLRDAADAIVTAEWNHCHAEARERIRRAVEKLDRATTLAQGYGI